MKYIRVFDKDHKILDEIHEYNTLVHGFVLNTISKCSFNVSLLQKTVAIGETVTLKSNALMINEIANFNIMSKRHGTTRPNLAIGHNETSGLAAGVFKN